MKKAFLLAAAFFLAASAAFAIVDRRFEKVENGSKSPTIAPFSIKKSLESPPPDEYEIRQKGDRRARSSITMAVMGWLFLLIAPASELSESGGYFLALGAGLLLAALFLGISALRKRTHFRKWALGGSLMGVAFLFFSFFAWLIWAYQGQL